MAVPDKQGGISVKAVNDTLKAQKLSLALSILDPAGKVHELKFVEKPVPADKAIEIARLKKGELPAGHILIMDYDAADGSKARAHFAAEPYKALHIIDPQLTHRAEIRHGKLHIHLAAHHAALFVVAETGVDGHYSDNVLDLLPGESATIIFTPDNPADLKSAAQNLVIRNLYSSSH